MSNAPDDAWMALGDVVDELPRVRTARERDAEARERIRRGQAYKPTEQELIEAHAWARVRGWR